MYIYILFRYIYVYTYKTIFFSVLNNERENYILIVAHI